MHSSDEVRMTFSGIVLHKGEKTVQVIFERGTSDIAEGSVPEGKITKFSGFSEEEIEQLNYYLTANAALILDEARKINPIKGFMGKK